jgi:hypothetical protein
MADNVAITAGSGTDISTDDAGAAGHVQRIKLSYSADGVATHIPADADGLLVNLGANNDVTIASLPALAAGTNNIGDVDVLTLPALPAGTNNIGDVDVLTVPSDPFGANADAASASGSISAKLRQIATNGIPDGTVGSSTVNSTSSDGGTALTNTAQAIKASAGSLLGYYIYNPNSSAMFVQVYNTASGSVTVGTTSPLFMLTIPAASAANLWMPGGIAFGTAMSWSATSTAGGNGAPTTALDAVAWYK